MWRWARWALVAVLVMLAAQWAGALWMGHTFRHFWNDIQINEANGQVTQINGFSPTYALYLDLFYAAAAAIGIVFLVWQHSAATVARAVGYPARTSPAFGVGAWFIPVVNLWMPYWALCDTLPPDHPMRPRCLWAWLSYIAAVASAAMTFFVAIASTAAAIVVMVISAALGLTAIAIGVQLITAVSDDHRRLLAGA